MEFLKDYGDIDEPVIPAKIDIPQATQRRPTKTLASTPFIFSKQEGPESSQKSKLDPPIVDKPPEKLPQIPFGSFASSWVGEMLFFLLIHHEYLCNL
jgi:hypothetical protein